MVAELDDPVSGNDEAPGGSRSCLQINFIPRGSVTSSATYTATLDARRETVAYLAVLLQARRVDLGIRKETRALGCFKLN
jgi:hypothetical protein